MDVRWRKYIVAKKDGSLENRIWKMFTKKLCLLLFAPAQKNLISLLWIYFFETEKDNNATGISIVSYIILIIKISFYRLHRVWVWSLCIAHGTLYIAHQRGGRINFSVLTQPLQHTYPIISSQAYWLWNRRVNLFSESARYHINYVAGRLVGGQHGAAACWSAFSHLKSKG